jgi:hypothetical protein
MARIGLSIVVLACLTTWVQADFVSTSVANGTKFYIDKADGVASFSGHVGDQSSGPVVDVTTIGSVDTGSGWATIKPIKDGTLTELIFTPQDPNLFDSFDFHCQLPAEGDVKLDVMDNLLQTFTFTIDKKNANEGPFGIIAKDGTGETIKSVRLYFAAGDSNVFNEVKQIDFGFAPGGGPTPGPTPVPLPAAVWGSLGLLAVLGVRRAVRSA